MITWSRKNWTRTWAIIIRNMKKPFPLLDLPNDCVFNVLNKLSNIDLFRLGSVPLGDVRPTYSYVMDTRSPSATDVKINKCVFKGTRTQRRCNDLRVDIQARVVMYKWMQAPTTLNVTFTVGRRTGMMLGMESFVGLFVLYKDSTGGGLQRIYFAHPTDQPSAIRMLLNHSAPVWLPHLLEALIPRLRSYGYERCKEKRESAIGVIGLMMECINQSNNME